MFLFDEPSPQRIARFLDAQRAAPFSYDEVGATRKDAKTPTGYAVDHNRTRLGRGRDTFERALAALYSWKMFDVGWARLVPVEAPIEVGTTVAVLARHYGFHSLNPCRISYTIEEDEGGLVRRGFAYGTLPGHGERGRGELHRGVAPRRRLRLLRALRFLPAQPPTRMARLPAGPAPPTPLRQRLAPGNDPSHQS